MSLFLFLNYYHINLAEFKFKLFSSDAFFFIIILFYFIIKEKVFEILLIREKFFY